MRYLIATVGALLLATTIVQAAAPDGGAASGSMKTMDPVLARLNLDYPGLEQVRAAAEAGNFPAAQAAYLAYYRSRTSPVATWNPLHGLSDSFEMRSTAYDFFTVRPETITWRDRDRLTLLISRGKGYKWEFDGLKPSEYTLVELADLILDNKVYHPWWPHLPPQDLGKEWDWNHVPPDGDQSWNYHLHHEEFLLAPAQAYWLTGEDKYVRKLVEVWTDWIARVARPVNLSHLVQPLLYQDLLPFALSWEGFRPQDFWAIQGWLSGPNADALLKDPRVGNQLMGTGVALLWLGIGMPEFRDASKWRAEGWRRTASFFVEGSSYPDGSAKETCFSYAVDSCLSGLQLSRLTQANGIPFPPELTEQMTREAEFYAYTSRPDGNWVWNGDGGRGSAFDVVSYFGRLAKREDLLYIASFGAEGSEPKSSSAWFPYAGYGVMRSGWRRDANYLFFDVGPLGIQHQHEGKLAVEVAAYGRSLVEDLGIHTYSVAPQEIPMLKFFQETGGHNTVIVDGKSQMRLATGPYVTDTPLPNPWHSSPICDFLAGSYTEGYGTFSGYAQGPGPIDESVAHHRSVVFVKAQQAGDPEYWVITDRLTGSGEHTYEALFHLIPVEVEIEDKTVLTVTAGQPNLAFIPAAPGEVELEVVSGRPAPHLQGWYISGSMFPVPAPCVIYSSRGAPPATFQTVLWPLRAGETALPVVEALGERGSGAVKITLPDGRVDIYCSPAAAGPHVAEQLSFDGLAALLRLGKDGAPLFRQVIQGPQIP